MKGYCIACLFLMFHFCSVSWGQVPPYQYANYKMIDEKTEDYVKKSVFYDTVAKLSYNREDIPFYSFFNYASVDDYNLESNFLRVHFRNYSSFTAPSDVKKITYYLGNNLIDSTKNMVHEFYFNQQTNLLEREIEYERDELGWSNLANDSKIEYIYQYEESSYSNLINKFVQTRDSLVLVNQFIYSKDRSKLLKNVFVTQEHDLKIIKANVVSRTKEVLFTYDSIGNIKQLTFNKIGTNYDVEKKYYGKFAFDPNSYDYKQEKVYEHGWSKKGKWFFFLKKMKRIDFQFPGKIDLIFSNKYNYLYWADICTSHNLCIRNNFSISTESSTNVFISKYTNEDSNLDANRHHNYINHKIFLFDKNHQLSNLYIGKNYFFRIGSNVSWKYENNTPVEYVFLTKSHRNNSYNIHHIQKMIPDYGFFNLGESYWSREYHMDWFKHAKYLKNEEYALEVVPKKGLYEIYLIYKNKTLPLITIN